MKKFVKNDNGFTVKKLIFTIALIILVFLVGFALAYVISNRELQNESNFEETVYEEDEAKSTEDIVLEAYNKAIDVFAYFEYDDIEENNESSEIKNYSEIIKQTFTENGQKIFEEENKGLIEIRNGKAYILAGDENTGEYVMDIKAEDIKKEDNKITATIVRKMSKTAISMLEEDEKKEDLETYELKDEIVLKRSNNNWLIDEYSWVLQ